MSLIQYVILRKDLQTVLNWPLGALIDNDSINLMRDARYDLPYIRHMVYQKRLAWFMPQSLVRQCDSEFSEACHASTAVLHLHRDDPNTQSYMAKLDSMHKVVLQAPDLESLSNLATELSASDIDHKLWTEQPENIPTCIALKPYTKNEVKGFLQKFKLYG